MCSRRLPIDHSIEDTIDDGAIDCRVYDRWCPLLPRRVKLMTVFGEPLALPKIEKPSPEDVDQWHAAYVEVSSLCRHIVTTSRTQHDNEQGGIPPTLRVYGKARAKPQLMYRFPSEHKGSELKCSTEHLVSRTFWRASQTPILLPPARRHFIPLDIHDMVTGYSTFEFFCVSVRRSLPPKRAPAILGCYVLD